MPNPFNRTVNPIQNYNMAEIRNMYQTIMNSKNPMQMFENLASRNPNLAPIVNALRSGANPQSLFEALCRERGINPNEFLKSIQGKS